MILGRSVMGDYYGEPYEFDPNKNLKEVKDDIVLDKPGKFNITDDSILTFATAKWLLGGKLDKEHLIRLYKSFTRRYPSSYGVGFARWAMGASDEPYYSCGNGSAMRVSPIGWYAETLDECLSLAKLSAEVTHNHPEGIKGAQATAAVIFLQRQGETIDDICRYVTNTFHYNLDRTYEDIHKIYKFEGTCQKTVPEAIIIWRDTPDYLDAIVKSIALGGDADTLACITGGFYVGDHLDEERCFPKKFDMRSWQVIRRYEEFVDINLQFDNLFEALE